MLDDGRLWYGTLGGGVIGSVDTVTGDASDPISTTDAPSCDGCRDTYGITADADGRIWFVGWGCLDVIGYDTIGETWSRLVLDAWLGLSGRGLRVDPEGTGVAQGGDGAGSLQAFPADSFAPGEVMDVSLRSFSMPAGHDGPSGVCVDSEGYAWMEHRLTSQLTRLDRETGRVTSFVGPNRAYTYSDFSGWVRRNVLRVGFYDRVIDFGCDAPEWTELSWDADVPAGSRLAFSLRSADTEEGLEPIDPVLAVEATGAGSIDLTTFFEDASAESGRLLGVVVRLEQADGEESPALPGVRARWTCPEWTKPGGAKTSTRPRFVAGSDRWG